MMHVIDPASLEETYAKYMSNQELRQDPTARSYVCKECKKLKIVTEGMLDRREVIICHTLTLEGKVDSIALNVQ